MICSCTNVCWNSVRWKMAITHRPACPVPRTACFGPELIVKEYTRLAPTFQSLLLLIVSHCCQSGSHASHEMQVCFLLWKTCSLQLNRALKIHSISHSWGGFFFEVRFLNLQLRTRIIDQCWLLSSFKPKILFSVRRAIKQSSIWQKHLKPECPKSKYMYVKQKTKGTYTGWRWNYCRKHFVIFPCVSLLLCMSIKNLTVGFWHKII